MKQTHWPLAFTFVCIIHAQKQTEAKMHLEGLRDESIFKLSFILNQVIWDYMLY